MKIYVTTSDWYNPLIPCFAYLFNRFWSPQQEVTILCYTVPDYEIPSNFLLESLGDPAAFGNDIGEWSPGRRGSDFGESFPTPKWSDGMKPNRSPWDFEELGAREQLNDGCRILGVAQDGFGPVPYLNVYSRGEVCWSQLGLLDEGIKTEMFARGCMGPHWNGWSEP